MKLLTIQLLTFVNMIVRAYVWIIQIISDINILFWSVELLFCTSLKKKKVIEELLFKQIGHVWKSVYKSHLIVAVAYLGLNFGEGGGDGWKSIKINYIFTFYYSQIHWPILKIMLPLSSIFISSYVLFFRWIKLFSWCSS
jgi:hypothetical protein